MANSFILTSKHFNAPFAIMFSEGIPHIYYDGDFKEYSAMAMDLLGTSFEKIQTNFGGTLPLTGIAIFAIEALEILKGVHARRIVHRDLKPENFALDVTRTKIMLFGNYKEDIAF